MIEVALLTGFLFACIFCAGFASFWLTGLLYGVTRTPSVYFPPSLALKMTVAALLGTLLMGWGAIITATAVFVHEFKKRSDFVMWKSVMVGGTQSIFCCAVMLFTAYWLLLNTGN
ncbi:MAG: hypothetical protein PsegKO_28310 [Pseudohongiellaceae bacterium]